MLRPLKRILTARGFAAVAAVGTSMLALHMLPGSEYAVASVAFVVSGVALPLFYQPFSKYVLISGSTEDVETIFWSVQPVMAALAIAAVMWSGITGAIPVALVLAACVFAISQGWKEFCGELARSRGDIASMQRLYVFDALTTLLGTLVALRFHDRAEGYIYPTAISSAFWSLLYLSRPTFRFGDRMIDDITRVYRYSYGLIATSGLNATGLALARTAILGATPPATSSAVQFVLDLFQKPTALIGSSTISAVLPEVRRSSLDGVIPMLVLVMSAAFGMLVLASLTILALPEHLVGKLSDVDGITLLACALFIWANRYKSTVMDIPLISSASNVSRLLLGGVWSSVMIFAITRLELATEWILVLIAISLFTGGGASLYQAYRTQLLSSQRIAMILVPPTMLVSFICALLAIHPW